MPESFVDRWQATRDELLLGARFEVKMMTHPLVKARVTVNFGVFKVKGFTVREKDSKSWVMPPSVRTRHTRSGMSPLFFCEDKAWWKLLEQAILQAAKRKQGDEEVADGRRKRVA